MLGKIIATPANLLLLDEPTNHLDMQSIDSLCDAIEAFPGSVIMVTHSEMLLRRLADQLIIFRKGGAEFFEGDYESFLEKIGWDEEGADRSEKHKEEVPKVPGRDRKALKKRRSELIARRGKELTPLKKEIERCERRIMELEEAVEQHNGELIEASQNGDADTIQQLSKSLSGEQEEIEALFEELICAQEKFDMLTAQYEKELEAL